MYASVRTTVLPDFAVDVYPTAEEQPLARQRYVLVLRDGTAGVLELVFPSAREFRYFLHTAHDAFDAARQQAKASRYRPRYPARHAGQASPF